MEKNPDDIFRLLHIRMAVAYLGESGRHGWWRTSFLDATGLSYLELVFPKTVASAGVTAASAAACRAHDEHIGRGKVAHLFRLPHILEASLFDRLRSFSRDDLEGICSTESAMQVLEEAAEGSRKSAEGGPIRVGSVQELAESTAASRLAVAYLTGFRAEQPVYPYLTEDNPNS